MNRNKQFKNLEKNLKEKFINIKENEVVLREEDFKDGKLTRTGYISLKLQSDYIAVNEDVEIKVPKAYIKGFKEQLELMATKELLRIKSDMKDTNIIALILFISGIALLSLPAIFSIFRTTIINEIILIVSWVFTWAAVEKKFFTMHILKSKRQNILHILISQILTY